MRRLTAFVSIIILSFILFIGIVNARGGIFIIELSGKVTERVELRVSDEVHGDLSVSNGFVDFYMTSPSGIVLLCYNKTAFNGFNFVAEEDGNHTIHLVNAHQTENVNVTLNYVVHAKLISEDGASEGSSAGTATVLPSIPPPPDPDIEPDNPYRKYLNFLKAHEIVRAVRGVRRYIPLKNGLLFLGCIAIATAFVRLVKFVNQRSFPASLMN